MTTTRVTVMVMRMRVCMYHSLLEEDKPCAPRGATTSLRNVSMCVCVCVIKGEEIAHRNSLARIDH